MSSSAAAGAEQEPEVEFEALRGSAGRGELASHKPPAQAALRLGAPSFAGEHLDLGSPLFSFSPLQPRAVSREQHTCCGVPGATSCRNHSPSAASLASPSLERRLCCMKTSPSRAVLTRSSPGKQEATSRGGRARLGLLGDTGDVPQPPPAGKPKECFPGKHASGFYLAS